jgi:hypothetical protein
MSGLEGRPTNEKVDPRMPRFDQATAAVVLAVGYGLELGWTIPLWAVVLGLSALRPGDSPVLRFWRAAVAPRRSAGGDPTPLEEHAPWRTTALLEALLLALGTVILALGYPGLAWVAGLVVAGAAALGAIGVSPGCSIHFHLAERGRAPRW